MKYTILLFFTLVAFLYAEQDIDIDKIKSAHSLNSEKQYQKDLDRQHMLRKAKFLKKKYEESILKLQNWEIKKENLKQEFAEKYRVKETSFGEGNEYGKQRAKKRKAEYYNSLQTQEQHIIDSFTSVQTKLKNLQDEFVFRFAVPLTSDEINDGVKPSIEDRDKRVEMLNRYMNENDAWRRCNEKVAEFDKVQSIASSIEKLFPDTNLTQVSILNKSRQNQNQMQNHLDHYLSIDEEYKAKYGVSILSEIRAKSMLEYIKNN